MIRIYILYISYVDAVFVSCCSLLFLFGKNLRHLFVLQKNWMETIWDRFTLTRLSNNCLCSALADCNSLCPHQTAIISSLSFAESPLGFCLKIPLRTHREEVYMSHVMSFIYLYIYIHVKPTSFIGFFLNLSQCIFPAISTFTGRFCVRLVGHKLFQAWDFCWEGTFSGPHIT